MNRPVAVYHMTEAQEKIWDRYRRVIRKCNDLAAVSANAMFFLSALSPLCFSFPEWFPLLVSMLFSAALLAIVAAVLQRFAERRINEILLNLYEGAP